MKIITVAAIVLWAFPANAQEQYLGMAVDNPAEFIQETLQCPKKAVLQGVPENQAACQLTDRMFGFETHGGKLWIFLVIWTDELAFLAAYLDIARKYGSPSHTNHATDTETYQITGTEDFVMVDKDDITMTWISKAAAPAQ